MIDKYQIVLWTNQQAHLVLQILVLNSYTIKTSHLAYHRPVCKPRDLLLDGTR
jgi:hypothetical protein